MPREEADLSRLGAAIKLRRAVLKHSLEAAAKLASMSTNTWGRIERGETESRTRTYIRVDEVLDWPAGTSVRILDDPNFVPPGIEKDGVLISQPPIREEALRQAIQNATIATAPGLTGAQIVELQERALEELRRQGLLPEAS